MNQHNTSQPSFAKSLLKGFFYTALSGALMAGIFMGVNAGAVALGLGATAATTIAVVAVATGLFGSVLQGISHIRGQDKAMASLPMRGQDIAITAASQNLMQPRLQPALMPERSLGQELMEAPASRTSFQDRVPHRSVAERANALLSRDTSGSHAERLLREREAASLAPSGKTIH